MYREHEPLAGYTSWRIGGPARYLAGVTSEQELRDALGWAAERGLPTFLLGGGTNTLVRDAGFGGLVVRYRSQELRVDRDGPQPRAWVAAGAPMAGTARRLARQGLAGLEWAEGLPGTIGGAVFGNAGCYGGDIAGALERAWLLVDGEVQEWPAARLGLGYRTSILKEKAKRETLNAKPAVAAPAAMVDDSLALSVQPLAFSPVVLAAEFRLSEADPAELAATMERTAATRKSKTPWGSSCGSVFTNPPGDSAGRLIEAAGLKGARVGLAEIARAHANYIVNLGGASSDDVLRLMDLAQAEVLRQFGVELRPEVQIIG